jgi:serine/threonine protein kinase
MVSSELGACEWFVWDLRRSGLIDRGQLDQVIGEYLKRNPRAEPPALADFLVGQGILSAFQAERILTGKTQGLVLGPYILADSIGSGSMGQVYKASSKTDNQMYAIKVLPRRSMWNVRLARRQVRSFSQFSHAGVVPFVDVGTSGGLHYLVWPFVEGETLEARVQREGKIPPAVVGRMALQIAQALTICHQNGIFHGLIKPSNIMIGNDGQARLLDFGIGSLLVENEGESLVDTMSTANTLTSGLDCSSPESIMEPTNRTPAGDQYSLGCTLYYALAGRYPFADGTAVEKMMAHQSKQPTSLRELVNGIPDGLIAVVEKLMQKAPDSRYNGADEMADALHPFAVEAPAAASPKPASYFGQVKSPVSKSMPEPVRSATPLPGVGGLPLPKPAPASHLTVPSASAPTAQVATVAPPPQLPSVRTAVPASVPTVPRAPVPTRQSIQSAPPPQAAAVVHAPPVPMAMPVATPAPQKSTAPAWVAEQPARTGIGPLLIVLVAALITVLVYLLGKNFIFPSS